jgi:hypothetical protein
MDDPVFNMLAVLRKRPAKYIGRCSVETLRTHLIGYRCALEDHADFDLTRFDSFIEGLYTKYGRGGGGHSWAWVLGQAAGGDAAGLDLFFAEMDAFCEDANRP